jgi:hypothetical protein
MASQVIIDEIPGDTVLPGKHVSIHSGVLLGMLNFYVRQARTTSSTDVPD